MVTSRSWRAVVACAWFALAPASAHAAELAWHAPPECQRADVVAAQVEKLVGWPLASIEAIAFEVEIAIDADATHRVVLRTLAQGSAPRERSIAGASCAEVTDAVSVAIALTINEEEQREHGAERPDSANDSAAEAPSPSSPQPVPPAELRLAVGLGLLMDAGALPDLVPGFDLGGALELQLLRVAMFVAVFVPQDAELPDATAGGTFDFVLGGFDVCVHPELAALHLLACAGFELGRIGARGQGVRNEREGDAGWYAPRVELGAGYGFAQIARVWLRGGLVIPLTRPEFVLDDVNTVHQPSSTAFRAVLMLELVL